MKSIDASKVLSKHLLTSLNLFNKYDDIIGPKGDNNHHFHEVHVIKGDDDYSITAVTSITEDSIQAISVDLKSSNRFRGMSGVCITFWSEQAYIWTRSIFFHKGCIYEQDIIVQDNISMCEDEDEAHNEETNGY